MRNNCKGVKYMEYAETMQAQARTWLTLKTLENATGEEFERYVHFFLLLIHKEYMKTRLKKDDGIDGFITLKRHALSNRIPIEYFSIYGPESKTTWKNNISKIKKDFEAVLIDSKKTESIISKWYLVTNFDSTKGQVSELKSEMRVLCEKHNIPYESYEKIEFEWYYPDKMISKLKSEEQISQAAAFTHSLEVPHLKLTDLHYHTFAKEALNLLSRNEGVSTTEKLDFVKYIHQSILFYIPEDIYIDPNVPPEKPYRINEHLSHFTKLHSTEGIYIHEYDIKKRQFFTYNYEEAKHLELIKDDAIWFNKNHSYLIRIEDLRFIFRLNLEIWGQLRRKGGYTIDKAIATLYRRQKLIKDIKLKSLGA